MTLTELIEDLQSKLDTYGDLTVCTSSDYGDYNHTEQILDIEEVAIVIPEDTAYSRTGLMVPEDFDSETFPFSVEGKQTLCVLRYTT